MKLPKELTTVTTFSKYLALSLFVLLPILTFFLGMRYSQLTYKEVSSPTISTRILSITPTHTISPDVSDWKTYNNTKYKFSIQYPSTYNSKLIPNDEGINLEKDIKRCVNCGYAGGTEVEKGIMLGFGVMPGNFEMSEDGLKKYLKLNKSTDLSAKTINVGGTKGIEIISNPETGISPRTVYLNIGKNCLVISLTLGYSPTKQELENYLLEYDQILASVVFLN